MKGCKSAAPTQQVTNQLKGLPESAENLTERQVNNTDASWPWVTASVYKHRALTCRITDEPQFGQTASASPLKRHLINALLFCLRKRQHVFRTPWLDVVVQKRGEENKKSWWQGTFMLLIVTHYQPDQDGPDKVPPGPVGRSWMFICFIKSLSLLLRRDEVGGPWI